MDGRDEEFRSTAGLKEIVTVQLKKPLPASCANSRVEVEGAATVLQQSALRVKLEADVNPGFITYRIVHPDADCPCQEEEHSLQVVEPTGMTFEVSRILREKTTQVVVAEGELPVSRTEIVQDSRSSAEIWHQQYRASAGMWYIVHLLPKGVSLED